MADAGDEFHAEKIAVEADCLNQVAGDEGEMVDACEVHDDLRGWSGASIARFRIRGLAEVRADAPWRYAWILINGYVHMKCKTFINLILSILG